MYICRFLYTILSLHFQCYIIAPNVPISSSPLQSDRDDDSSSITITIQTKGFMEIGSGFLWVEQANTICSFHPHTHTDVTKGNKIADYFSFRFFWKINTYLLIFIDQGILVFYNLIIPSYIFYTPPPHNSFKLSEFILFQNPDFYDWWWLNKQTHSVEMKWPCNKISASATLPSCSRKSNVENKTLQLLSLSKTNENRNVLQWI